MVFNPSKPIILQTEASFNEGLSAALLQETDKGIQPVHFISRTMTETREEVQSNNNNNNLFIYIYSVPFNMLGGQKHITIINNLKTINTNIRNIKTYVISKRY